MGMGTAVLDSPDMAKQKRQKREDAEQFNVNLPVSLVKRLREYCNTSELQPTYTQVTVAALNRYLDAEEPNLPKRPRPK